MSKRLLRVNELIQQEVSKLFSKEIEVPEGSLVTVAKAETTRNLKSAKVWVSIFPFEKRKKILKILKKNQGKIQFLLNRKLSMYPLPRIDFKIDDTEERANKVEEILNNLDNKNKN